MNFKVAFMLLLLSAVGQALAEVATTDSFNGFIKQMVKQHRFNETELRSLFKAVNIQQPILDAMSKPAEGKPWFQYREIFMTEARIAGGVQFWKDNEAALRQAEHQYGVPADIIVAIIGVETKYGAHTGKYRVIDALATLGFAYPPRSEFFLKELEQYLVLAREEGMDPLQPMGSYAGAMGLPQFMPSSFRSYAKDLDGDGKRNIWTNPADAIASVANYFASNQWKPGGLIAYPVNAAGEAYKKALSKGVKPYTSAAELRKLGVELPAGLPAGEAVKLLAYQQQIGEDLWIGLHNFYVITRYNHSPLYAMAVYQLSQAIAARKL
ncbi:lytic murein transglycosylase B [Methylomonas sp. LWB]|uniref:lytic murein transglycosylase B n=1 Tax=Methylomonas sp. LWB TaxID=1905845 RepID=UPI0008D94764|nr:lytic murein transglycosylase B [Methylomonas sp. LWB]OHX38280.1 lytic murein transglycosylase B [Methylomonas sp. LWB]